MSRCKCTGGEWRGGIGQVGDISFSLKNLSSFVCLCEAILNYIPQCCIDGTMTKISQILIRYSSLSEPLCKV